MSALPSGISTTVGGNGGGHGAGGNDSIGGGQERGGTQLPGPHPVLAPVGDPRVLPLDRPVTLVGSGARCRLHLRSSTVSKVHAVMVRDGAVVYVRDLASREGVRVDGELVRECLLSGGEKVEIGRFTFLFEGVLTTRMPPRAPGGSLMGVEIESRTFVIGRRKTCDLMIDSDEVSSAHAILLEHNGRRYVRDLSSRTGVLLNGQKVHWEYLKSGDVITVGGQEMVYVEAEAVKAESRMRISTTSGSVVLGPGGVVEQTTLLSESMSGSVDALRDEDVGVGSGMGTSTIAQGLPALAFDDGTEARDDDPAPKTLASGPLFSVANLPVANEFAVGAEAAAGLSPQTTPEEPMDVPEAQTPVLGADNVPTSQKILPPTYPTFDHDLLPTAAPVAPEPAVQDPTAPELSVPESSAPELAAPEETGPFTASATHSTDDFEAMMAGLDVAREDDRSFGAAQSDGSDEAAGGLTLTLDFDDIPLPPENRSAVPVVTEPKPEEAAVESVAEAAEPVVVPEEPVVAPFEPVATVNTVAETTFASITPATLLSDPADTGVTMTAVTNAFVGQTQTISDTATPADETREVAPANAPEATAVDEVSIDEPAPKDAGMPAELGRLLRTTDVITEPSEEPEPGARGAKIFGIALRLFVVLGVAAGAGYAAWVYFQPTTVATGRVSLPLGTDGKALMLSESVREKAAGALATQSPGTSPGELQNDALLRRWSEAATVDGGVLTVTVPADAAQAARLKSLLTAVSETATPVRVTAAQAITAAEEQLKAASAALTSVEALLSDAESHLRDGSQIASLSSDVRDAEKDRDQIAARLESLRSAAPVADENARKTLDAAVDSFQKQLQAARNQPTADQRLSAFASAAQSIQEQGATLMDEILRSRKEQAERLVSLRKRLDERMRIRQQQAWDSDGELKRLSEQLETAKRSLTAAREKNDATATQDLTGEVDYLEGLVKSRRALIGQDKGDQRALAEVQSIIEEQAQATEQDRKRLADSFEQMRKSLITALPEAGTLSDVEQQLAVDLEKRLTELQTARTSLADATAAAMARHQESVKHLETQLAEADAKLVEKGQAVETARQSLPNTTELTALRDKAATARKAKENAERNLQLARSSESAPTLVAEVATSGSVQPHRAYYAGGAAMAALVLLSPMLRSRARDELGEA